MPKWSLNIPYLDSLDGLMLKLLIGNAGRPMGEIFWMRMSKNETQ